MNHNVIKIMQTAQNADRAALMIRHADRFSIPSNMMNDSLKVGLTEKGFKEAFDFGSSLPEFSSFRIFHSPAKRCQETAGMISESLVDRGLSVTAMEEDWDLCAPYIRDERCLMEAGRLGRDFLRSWFSGRIDEKLVYDTNESARAVLAPIIRKLNSRSTGLDIHVSHDWDIMLLRESLLGLRHEDVGWLSYLDGLVFMPQDDRFMVGYHDVTGLVEERYFDHDVPRGSIV